MVVFSLAGVACAATTSLTVLVAFRFVQGTGAAAGTVIARAMVRDTHEGSAAARLFATMMAVLAIAPMVAPLIGGILLTHLGWRAIFTTLAVFGVGLTSMTVLSLEETLPERKPFSFAAIAPGFARFVRTKEAPRPALVIALGFAAQFAFISGSPFVLIGGYQVKPAHYGFYFGATALALMAGSATGARLLKGGTPRRVVRIGGAVLLGAALLLLALVHAPWSGVLGLMAPVLGCFFGLGLVGPSAAAMAMDPVPDIAGTASAIIGFLQMTAGSLSGYVVAKVGGESPQALGWQMALLAAASAMVIFLGLTPRRAGQAAAA
ncbi:MFS transporter [Pendulispora rubella]